MTKQEYLDLLFQTSADGGFPSMRTEPAHPESCAYRGKDGKKCVAGLLIPDEKYDPIMEGATVDDTIISLAIELPEGMTILDVRQCQVCHDWMANDPWKHEKFVNDLLIQVKAFEGMTPTQLKGGVS